MSLDVVVPSMGESVAKATVAKWLKQAGDRVALDEPLVALDSDKATVEVPAPIAGTLAEVLADTGAEVTIGQVLGRILAADAAVTRPARGHPVPPGGRGEEVAPALTKASRAKAARSSPAVRQAAREAGVDLAAIAPAGGDRVTREDVQAAVARPAPAGVDLAAEEAEEITPMTTIRRRIAERLLEAKNTTAMLTTFNEVDMSAVMSLRARHQERFVERHGVKLGFMSFFAKACVEALKAYPLANAEIRGTDIVVKRYYHLGIAVSGTRGLVVPVLKHADRLSFAETEKAIAHFGKAAKAGTIGVDDLRGGTFTITNGGIFGSMMSTPILNPPQVAILGMHAIQERAVVRDGAIVARPMMYLALSYDHRLLDGREAVSFLVRVKECVENPERMLLEV
jgi:2-oxoglutarate dehydrogenase E2 component (dihydrolipoamide succinyltransferase)